MGVIIFLLLYKVKGLFKLIEDKSLFSFSITSSKVRPAFALLFALAKLIAISSFISPWDSCLRSISTIGRFVFIFSINKGKLVGVNWPLPDILSFSNPSIFKDVRAEELEILVVLRKWPGSELVLAESWIILTSLEASIGKETDVNKIIIVNKKVNIIFKFFFISLYLIIIVFTIY